MPPAFLGAYPALVFDLDGTLIDSAPDIAVALNAALDRFGRPPLSVERVRGMVGDGAAQLLRFAFAATGDAMKEEELPAVLAAFMEIYHAQSAEPSCLYEGVVETLQALRAGGVRLGLCTNKPERITKKLLGLLDLAPLFGEAVAGGDTLPLRKPDPAPLRWVMERLGVERAVMVGDGGNDVKVARAVGVPVVAVSYGYPRVAVADLGADLVIDHFADLPAALDRLAAAAS